MMQLLSERIRGLSNGRGFSTLYSDIGPKFYANNGGWGIHDAVEVSIPSSTYFEDAMPVELLGLQMAEDCIDKDVKLLRDELDSQVDRTVVQMIPQHSELEWCFVREKQSAAHLNLGTPEIVGAKVGSGNEWGYVLWFHEYTKSSLTVLRLREPTSDAAVKGLLGAALRETEKSGLGKVSIWSPSERVERVTAIKKVPRTSALPALLCLDEDENVQWQRIEKLGWC
jgi:hypothetical protein